MRGTPESIKSTGCLTAGAESSNCRACQRWDEEEMKRLGFHEARHTFASITIAAGLNPKTLSTYMGHSTITITLDRYGHLMPGSEVEARALLDAYLEE